MKVFALVVAAGSGTRMASGRDDKPFMELGGRPLVFYPLLALEKSAQVDSITLVVKENYVEYARAFVKEHAFKKVAGVVAGGETRTQSVRNGMDAINASDGDILLVQDGARPFVTDEMISSSVLGAGTYGAAVVGIPCTATIKEVGPEGVINGTPDRRSMWEAQTPQAFRFGIIKRAYRLFSDRDATDDSAFVEWMAQEVRMVEGDRTNIKVTVPSDLVLAEAILAQRK